MENMFLPETGDWDSSDKWTEQIVLLLEVRSEASEETNEFCVITGTFKPTNGTLGK